MAKPPAYLDIKWSFQPTENDEIGCDGLYIDSVKVKWWGWPILLFQWLTGVGRQ